MILSKNRLGGPIIQATPEFLPAKANELDAIASLRPREPSRKSTGVGFRVLVERFPLFQDRVNVDFAGDPNRSATADMSSGCCIATVVLAVRRSKRTKPSATGPILAGLARFGIVVCVIARGSELRFRCRFDTGCPDELVGKALEPVCPDLRIFRRPGRATPFNADTRAVLLPSQQDALSRTAAVIK